MQTNDHSGLVTQLVFGGLLAWFNGFVTLQQAAATSNE